MDKKYVFSEGKFMQKIALMKSFRLETHIILSNVYTLLLEVTDQKK